MENTLIQIYLFVCQIYDTSSDTCYQRMSNNCEPRFTDQELITIWFFAHLNHCLQKKQMHELIQNYWSDWFPHLPSYQTFVFRLNHLEATFQTFGGILSQFLATAEMPEIDRIVDSMPVMLAAHGHSYSAKVAREIADIGYCATLENSLSWCSVAPYRTAKEWTLADAFASLALPSVTSRLKSFSPTINRTPNERVVWRFSIQSVSNH